MSGPEILQRPGESCPACGREATHTPIPGRPGTVQCRTCDAAGGQQLPPWQAARLAVLLDAIGEVPITEGELASLTWITGFEVITVQHLAAVIHRARGAEQRPGLLEHHPAGRLDG